MSIAKWDSGYQITPTQDAPRLVDGISTSCDTNGYIVTGPVSGVASITAELDICTAQTVHSISWTTGWEGTLNWIWEYSTDGTTWTTVAFTRPPPTTDNGGVFGWLTLSAALSADKTARYWRLSCKDTATGVAAKVGLCEIVLQDAGGHTLGCPGAPPTAAVYGVAAVGATGYVLRPLAGDVHGATSVVLPSLAYAAVSGVATVTAQGSLPVQCGQAAASGVAAVTAAASITTQVATAAVVARSVVNASWLSPVRGGRQRRRRRRMAYDIAKGNTTRPLLFRLIANTDHQSPTTGQAGTVAVVISKSGGAFAPPAGAITEIGNGWYAVAANATDANTLGPLALYATQASSDPWDDVYMVVNYSPDDIPKAVVNDYVVPKTAVPAGSLARFMQMLRGLNAGKVVYNGGANQATIYDTDNVTVVAVLDLTPAGGPYTGHTIHTPE